MEFSFIIYRFKINKMRSLLTLYFLVLLNLTFTQPCVFYKNRLLLLLVHFFPIHNGVPQTFGQIHHPGQLLEPKMVSGCFDLLIGQRFHKRHGAAPNEKRTAGNRAERLRLVCASLLFSSLRVLARGGRLRKGLLETGLGG